MDIVIPRILCNFKDHPTLNSGYGIIARYLLPLLRDRYGAGNIIIYAPVYQRDQISEWEDMTVVSGTEWGYGENMILDHYNNFNCNMLIQIGDAWPLGTVPDLAEKGKICWIQWIAVDWLGMPKNVIYRIRPAYKLVPFSQYGETALRKAGLANVERKIWPGLNIDLWKPEPREFMPKLMQSLGYSSDSFNILIVAANQERKRVRQALEGIALFRRVKPDAKVHLYLHSPVTGERDLRADCDEIGLVDIVTTPDPYIMTQGGFEEKAMVKIFNCADIVINVAMEGYGYAQVQAQSVGVPVIYLNEGAGPELVQFGWEVSCAGVETSAHQMTQPIPNSAAIGASLGEAWETWLKRGKKLRSDSAIRWIRDNLGWRNVADQWCDVIDKCAYEQSRGCQSIPNPSAELDKRAAEITELS